METTTTRITAAPCGKDRHGNPLAERTYEVDGRREDWGDGRTRVFVRRRDLDARPGQQCFAPELVRTDTIKEAAGVQPVEVGDTVRIVRGMHADRLGKVTHAGATAVHVEITRPVLAAEQDGATETATLPFSRRELVRVAPAAVSA
ncbi:60S ribosomal protein L26 [Pimelobacter simplex]|uniref:60S ribosomal protein L26 n=1 Tax=Nocardioides simplex TaxID=2045 RepID=A0A7J5DQL5_NOCSI|nr:hypothetical protein [Pimelobacter simplex]KAB2806951.1 60S ribosomal protein L26 [Pimelobacter simplex]